MKCRFCDSELTHKFIDLVNAPPSNSFINKDQLNEPEVFYPLKLFVCDKCFLVQIDEYKKSDDIFNQTYAYFSSFSTTWLKHAKKFADMITDRLKLNADSLVMEIASNDGYLLQYFQESQIPCFGIEPSTNTAKVAIEKGIETVVKFFNGALASSLAEEGKKADLIIGNNVLAHVPNINDFVGGLKVALKKTGVITMEFPHVMRMIEENQFDTIYHEHFSYFSFHTVCEVFKKHNLVIFDVNELSTHGGSLRVYARHAENKATSVGQAVADLLNTEKKKGLRSLDYYLNFKEKANKVKYNLLSFLLENKKEGRCVVAYGAAAKGNTLLNYCGIRNDLIKFVVDASPHKQGKFLPGSHIAVLSPDAISKVRPDFVLILPWNIKAEIMAQLEGIKKWGGKFVLPIPELKVI